MPRDYSLIGASAQRAQASGLVGQRWYRTPIDNKTMKRLIIRSDHPATRDTLLLFGLMAACAAVAIALTPSWYCIPFWLGYGVLYGSAMDSRWHECGHGTAFETRWKNMVVYQIACFCMIRDPWCWKFSHARHHADTIIVGRDPEIAIMRPVDIAKMISNLIGLSDSWDGTRRMCLHAAGRLAPDEAVYVGQAYHRKTFRTARIWLAIYIAAIAAAALLQTLIPLLLIGLPRLYGCWHMTLCGWLQHGGLADNVLDHRMNSRTVLMNPISRFIYWNMNYHIEHHMFPMVPYHRLPALHAICKHDFPAPNTSFWQAYAEMLPVILRQRRDPDAQLIRPLPDGATPYRAPPQPGAPVIPQKDQNLALY